MSKEPWVDIARRETPQVGYYVEQDQERSLPVTIETIDSLHAQVVKLEAQRADDELLLASALELIVESVSKCPEDRSSPWFKGTCVWVSRYRERCPDLNSWSVD